MQVMFDEEPTEFQSTLNGDSKQSSQIEEEEGLVLTNENIVLDFDLYKKFWSLQEYFRMPVLCFKPLHWKKFTDCADETIELFSNFKTDTTCNLHALDSLEGNYFPKYLTSQKLLELQLCDSNFKRNVLIQFLILFQYLIGKVKFKTEQQVLNEDQLKWVKETTDRIMNLISKTPPNGELVKQAVSHILTREEFWSNWKNEACAELKKCNEQPKKKQKTTNSSKINLGERIKQAEKNNEIIIGSEQLTKIWNLNQNNWDACKTQNRVFVPTIDSYFESVLTKEGLEYKHYYTEEPLYCWRALRLLGKQSANFFFPTNNAPIKPVREYIEFTIDNLANDKFSTEINDLDNNKEQSQKSNSSISTNSEEIVYNLE